MQDYIDTYMPNPLVEENVFKTRTAFPLALPLFSEARSKLPQPVWDGHESTIACYWKAWEIAFRNLRNPVPENGFVSPYIDTAFNNHLFMWDSAFILLFGRYGRRAFNFQQTLDNFYAKQHPDGFICREIDEADGRDCFHRHDPPSTGPNVMPWVEWEYYVNFGDTERLAQVFAPLVAYYRWLRDYRTWRDGSYWACGWATGMDNQPRLAGEMAQINFHAHHVWIDANIQQILAARQLYQMAEILGRAADVHDLPAEADFLTQFVNSQMWDSATAFYYDLDRRGKRLPTKTVGAFWALLAGIVPPDGLERFVAHLNDPKTFNRPHRVPSLSADHPEYNAENGDYWRGGVWAPTNYMILRGLTHTGHDSLAHAIALNHVNNVVTVFEQTGTLWENYAPERPAPGKPAKPDFIGWTGLPPIAVLLEYVFGIRSDTPQNRIVWDVRLLDAFGVRQYPFGTSGLVDLSCAARQAADEKPVITAASSVPLTLEVRWQGGHETMRIG